MRTRTLLACGAVAGPLYVTVTLAQAATREGFDLTRHRFTLLTAGDLGWVHRSNMVLVGVLTVLLAIGAARVLRTAWGPRLLALNGLAYVVGGALVADPVPGFPPGAVAQATWPGMVQNASRGIGSAVLVGASLAVAAALAAQGHRLWAVCCAATIPVVLVVLTVVIGYGPAFLVTPWVWVTALALRMYRWAAVPVTA